MKRKTTSSSSDDSDSDTEVISNKVFQDVEFRFMLKDPNTVFSALEKFIRQCHYKNDDYDIALEYCISSPDCKEIVQLLEKLETRKSNEVYLIFSCLECILMRVSCYDDTGKHFSALTLLAKRLSLMLLNDHVATFYRMLNTRNRSPHIKSVLLLLVAIVVQNDDLALNVLVQFDFKHRTIAPLFDRIDMKDNKDIRTSLITLIIAFLVSGNTAIINNLLSIKGLVASIFNRVHADKLSTIKLLIPVIVDKIVHNKCVSKTQKLSLFGDYTLQNLSKLYYWNQGLKFDKTAVKNKRHSAVNGANIKHQHTWNVEEETEDQREVFEIVTNLFEQLCCSFNSGIIFRDKSHFKKNANPTITSFLIGLPHPHLRPMVGDLIARVLTTLPDQMSRYLPALHDSIVPRKSSKWFQIVKFLDKVYARRPDTFWNYYTAKSWKSVKVISIIKSIYTPPAEIWHHFISGMENKDLYLRYYCLRFVYKSLENMGSVMKFFEGACLGESKDIAVAIANEINKMFPNMTSIVTSWNNEQQIAPFIDDGQFEEIDQSDYLGLVMDTIASYLVNAPSLVVDFKINFTLFFESIRDTVDNKLDSNLNSQMKTEKLRFLQDKLLNLLSLSGQSKIIQWTKVGRDNRSSLRHLLDMFINDSNTINSVIKLLVEANVFGECNSDEPIIWLQTLLDVAQQDEDVFASFFPYIEKSMLKSMRNQYTYSDQIIACIAKCPIVPDDDIMETKSNQFDYQSVLDRSMDDLKGSFTQHTMAECDDDYMNDHRMPFSTLLMSVLDTMIKDQDQLKALENYLEQVIRKLMRVQTKPQILSQLIAERLIEDRKSFPLSLQYKTSNLTPILSMFIIDKDINMKLHIGAKKCSMISLEIIDDYIEANFVSTKSKRPIELPKENFNSQDFLKTFNQIVNYIKNLLERKKEITDQYFIILLELFKNLEDKERYLKQILENKFTQKHFLNFKPDIPMEFSLRHSTFICDLFNACPVDMVKCDTITIYSTKLKQAVRQYNLIISENKNCVSFERLLQHCTNEELLDTALDCFSHQDYLVKDFALTSTTRIAIFCIERLCKQPHFIGKLKLLKGILTIIAQRTSKPVKYAMIKILNVLLRKRPLYCLFISDFDELFKYPTGEANDVLEILSKHNSNFFEWLLNTKSLDLTWTSDGRYFQMISNLMDIDGKLAQPFSTNQLEEKLVKGILSGRCEMQISDLQRVDFVKKLLKVKCKDQILTLIETLKKTITNASQPIHAVQFDAIMCVMDSLSSSSPIYKGQQLLFCICLLSKSKPKKSVALVNSILAQCKRILEDIDDSAISEVREEMVELWMPFVKLCLKNHYGNPVCLGVVLSLVRRLSPRLDRVEMEHGNRRVSRVASDRQLDLNGVHCMLITHSAYQSAMFQYDDLPEQAATTSEVREELEEKQRIEEEQRRKSNAKEALVSLLLEIVRRQPILCCETDHLPMLFAGYTATLSVTDQTILMLLKIYESHGNCKFNKFKPYLFGRDAYDRYVLCDNKISRTLSKTEHISIACFNPKMMQFTSNNYPLTRSLEIDEELPIETIENGNECYDVGFILPMIAHIVAKERQVNARNFVTSGCLSVTLTCMSCHDLRIRGLASHILQLYKQHLDLDHRTPERQQLNILLEILKNSIPKRGVKLSCVVANFLNQVALITNKCSDHMYSRLNSFVLIKPFIELNNVPEFYVLFNSSNTEHKLERQWILTLLENSIRDMHDFRIMQKIYAYKLMLSYYASSISDIACKKLIVSILTKSCKLQIGAITLIKEHGIIHWITNTAIAESNTSSILQLFIVFCKTLWTTILQKRFVKLDANLKEISEEDLHSLRKQCLPKAFISNMIVCLMTLVKKLVSMKCSLNDQHLIQLTSTISEMFQHQQSCLSLHVTDEIDDSTLSLQQINDIIWLVDHSSSRGETSSSKDNHRCTTYVLSLLKHVALDLKSTRQLDNADTSSSKRGGSKTPAVTTTTGGEDGGAGDTYISQLVDTLAWMQHRQLCDGGDGGFEHYVDMLSWLQERCSTANNTLRQVLTMHSKLPLANIMDTFCYFSTSMAQGCPKDRSGLDNLLAFLMSETSTGDDLYVQYLSTVN